VDLVGQQFEPFLYIHSRFRTYLHIGHLVFPGKRLPLLSTNLPLIVQVRFGCQKDLAYVTGCVVFDLGDPSVYVFEGRSVDDGIGQYYARCAFIVGLSNILESLLPSSVPYLQSVPPVANCDRLNFEIHANGGDVGLFESALAVAGNENSFSDAAVPYYYDLCHVIIFFYFVG